MFEDLHSNFNKLIALYETEREERISLQERLAQSESAVEACRKQIAELERQIDNLRLAQAFGSEGSKVEAKEKINKLIKSIDKCITLLEK